MASLRLQRNNTIPVSLCALRYIDMRNGSVGLDIVIRELIVALAFQKKFQYLSIHETTVRIPSFGFP